MRASQEFIKQLEDLYQTYEQEITDKKKADILKESAAKTYLYHSGNFVRWCKNNFVPGARNANK
jgi:ABC-type Zn uptake system ZnuABC Zn-binding protein ZnuA